MIFCIFPNKLPWFLKTTHKKMQNVVIKVKTTCSLLFLMLYSINNGERSKAQMHPDGDVFASNVKGGWHIFDGKFHADLGDGLTGLEMNLQCKCPLSAVQDVEIPTFLKISSLTFRENPWRWEKVGGRVVLLSSQIRSHNTVKGKEERNRMEAGKFKHYYVM